MDLIWVIFRYVITTFVRSIVRYLSALGAIPSFIAPIASAVLAYLTWRVYQEQNDLIEDQTHASEEAQRASVQSLEVAGKDRSELSVIVKNSGGGAAKNLHGKVEFVPHDDITLESEPFRSRAVRQSSSGLTEENGDLEWVPSAGNELASGESEVIIEILCFGKIKEEDDPVAFSRMMSIIEKTYIIEALRNIKKELTADQLKELCEEGWNPSLCELAGDPEYAALVGEFEMNDLQRIQVTIVDQFDVDENRLCMERSFDFNVSLEYQDEFGKYETPILELFLEIDKGIELKKILSKDYSRQRRESDPRGHELDRLS
ncbi:hypothetical protein [Halorubrum cibi]|nr:hypothetical protein [Halorubrum cibi]